MADDLLRQGEGLFYGENLHCHSNRSDGLIEPEAVIGAYRDAGYDFLCLSDQPTPAPFAIGASTGYAVE